MQLVDRRHFIRRNAAAFAGVALAPGLARAAITRPGPTGASAAALGPTGFYRFSLGRLTVTSSYQEECMGTLDRRGFIHTAAAALAGAGGTCMIPPSLRSASAAARVLDPSAPGLYRFALGDFTITVVADGSFTLPAEIFGANVTAEQRAAYFDSRLLPHDRIRLVSNPAVIDTGSRRVLVDTGSSPSDNPASTTGRLPASLAAAGIAPESIDLVILTHAHPDHLGGLVPPATGGLRFPNAEVVISDVEHGIWSAADVASRVPDWVRESGIVEMNHRVFAALGDRLRTVPMESEIAAGIHSIATPGHTPGHIGVLVASGGEQLLMVGDAIATSHTHFERPEWHLAFDLDPDLGSATRRRLLDRIVTDRLRVQGFHLPFPGVGRAVRDQDAYRWLPDA
jgi:glyoxylase-like metal-dependent hydrolase (beta-lactamase superfamily II)